MPQTYSYSLGRVVIAINGVPIQGDAADGDKITIVDTNDRWSETIGADGAFTRNEILDTSADITLNLTYGSPYSLILSGLLLLDSTTGFGAFAMSIVDLDGGYNFNSARCYIKRRPDRAFGQESGATEWMIKATNCVLSYSLKRPI